MKIEVGAKIRKPPTGHLCFTDTKSNLYKQVENMEGTIIDVNRKHRHFTVEYEFGRGRKFRETFKMNRRPGVGGSERAVLNNDRDPRAKAVVCLTTGEVYASATEAACQTGGTKSGITACCRGEIPSYKKMAWAYLDGGGLSGK